MDLELMWKDANSSVTECPALYKTDGGYVVQGVKLDDGQWNVEAGEVIHYATTKQAHQVGLLPDAGPYDWWLLDDARILRMTFNDHNVCIERHLLTDEESLEQARTWREQAIRAAGS